MPDAQDFSGTWDAVFRPIGLAGQAFDRSDTSDTTLRGLPPLAITASDVSLTSDRVNVGLKGVSQTGTQTVATLTAPVAVGRGIALPATVNADDVQASGSLANATTIISFPFVISGAAYVFDAAFQDGRDAAICFLACFIITVILVRDPRGQKVIKTIADRMISLK